MRRPAYQTVIAILLSRSRGVIVNVQALTQRSCHSVQLGVLWTCPVRTPDLQETLPKERLSVDFNIPHESASLIK